MISGPSRVCPQWRNGFGSSDPNLVEGWPQGHHTSPQSWDGFGSVDPNLVHGWPQGHHTYPHCWDGFGSTDPNFPCNPADITADMEALAASDHERT